MAFCCSFYYYYLKKFFFIHDTFILCVSLIFAPYSNQQKVCWRLRVGLGACECNGNVPFYAIYIQIMYFVNRSMLNWQILISVIFERFFFWFYQNMLWKCLYNNYVLCLCGYHTILCLCLKCWPFLSLLPVLSKNVKIWKHIRKSEHSTAHYMYSHW